jgi:rhamnosyltransferase
MAVSAERYATVTVTYNPDLSVLARQLQALPATCLKVIVDNTADCQRRADLAAMLCSIPGVHGVWQNENVGLGAAINAGVRAVREISPTTVFVLLLDQDSEPRPRAVEFLEEAFGRLRERGVKVAAVGPTLVDPDTGLLHGFHQCTRWRWYRVKPGMTSEMPVVCASLNGSGTFAEVDTFLQQGGVDESLFIDHLDTEWSFRMVAAGYSLWGVPNAVFDHRMGEAGRRLWLFGWRIWPERSPLRHFFLYRNAVILMRRTYVPLTWKVWAAAKLAITACVVTVLGPRRVEQLSHMLHVLIKVFK